MKKLVIASNNPGKLREFQQMLSPLGFEVITQAQLGIGEAEEPHHTFVENAIAKARHVSRESGLPALADDSGICVNALHGLPGVISARFSGFPKSDERNNRALLEAMKPHTDRRAHYYCVLVLMNSAGDPQPLIAEGEWHGEIAHQERGEGGFGYDPLFWLPELGKMSAELTHDEKHAISHRGRAMKVLLEKLKS
ncbi:MAG: non-canonical purine NTP pyrophosphatase, RdgB/HAM1 family [Gallionellaceae bacterium CG1_02_56_997]|nr:MAG: non-canonical purine NTP pyrophosphatase, RdgB/HAM1 family [Gallionellaceae bacterium CG1_02_56_997]PIV14512.1 MAG: non-canonical purine NTP pyrophosphatase, RdgB/HAM1 family [Gallionellales bacterium CG03_land_8_20_14_0_80_55_15]HCJ50583.1 non-canonical purine NTP pyrophosphatase, RdgB/HAM1 family [Gallionella sp.]